VILAPAWRGIGPQSIIIGMEASGVIRDAFRARGFDAWSCDLRPCEADPAYHFTGDVFAILAMGWRLGIFHPDCTYLASSGLHWNKRVHGREACTLYALNTVRRIMACPIPMWAIENPRGRIGKVIRPADQEIQPYQFGDDGSKRTHLWLNALPKLKPTGWKAGRIVTPDPADLFGGGVERWSNQTDGGEFAEGETRDRWIKRSRTWPGIAAAMSDQWGSWLRSIAGRQIAIACSTHIETAAPIRDGAAECRGDADTATAAKIGILAPTSTTGLLA
jgi:hypothetical protein